jgi:pyruvate,orthophosphate dikinase
MNSPQPWPAHVVLIGAPDRPDDAEEALDRSSVGAKAANLARMAQLGLPVPAALVLGTAYSRVGTEQIRNALAATLPSLESLTGAVLGEPSRPLIVSVRSGAPVSMPGMLETLLNIGLCDATVSGLLRRTGNPRLVWDSYRRLVASYAETVMGLDPAPFDAELARALDGRVESDLDFSELRDLTRSFRSIYRSLANVDFPQSARDQLHGAVLAVHRSWQADKAQAYRARHGIDESLGTAVIVQVMVFGNAGGRSGAGVGFTRDPTTGDPRPWVDYLANAQGEDVVSGRRNAHGHQRLAAAAPHAWAELLQGCQRLEQAFGDMQDFEFTVEDGRLYWLQTRAGKRTLLATARIALDLLHEGVIDGPTARSRTDAVDSEQLGVMRLTETTADAPAGSDARRPLAQAHVASPGVAAGELVLDSEAAIRRVAQGAPVVLVRADAETRDIAAVDIAQGLLTQRGARTSHAAVVARQLGKTCLVACEGLRIDLPARCIWLGDMRIDEGSPITLCGDDGTVWPGLLAGRLVPDIALQERLARLREGTS